MKTTDKTDVHGDGLGSRVLVTPPSLDLAKYRALYGDADMAPEHIDDMLGVLASIMLGFVEWGWDVKTIPAFLPEIFDDTSAAAGGAVVSDDEETSDDEA